ncbi:DNA polymerase I domain protein [Mycobacterium xenopi 3993]|nr:DNA polymerase I domain protein [Mycobacterium xenopi 3993]
MDRRVRLTGRTGRQRRHGQRQSRRRAAGTPGQRGAQPGTHRAHPRRAAGPNPDTLRLQPWDRDQIHRLFDHLEFRVLRDRLFETLAAVEPEVDAGFDVRGGALEPGTVGQWLAAHAGDGRRCGLAVVGTHLPYGGQATALAIAAADGEGGYIDTATVTPADDAALAAWLADPDKPKALHEAKQAIHDLAGRGWTLGGVTSDTALAAYLVRPGSAASLSTTCRCATCAGSCALKPLSSNSFRFSTIPMASTTRRCKPRFCGPRGGRPRRRAGRRACPHRLPVVAGRNGVAGPSGAGGHGGRRYRRGLGAAERAAKPIRRPGPRRR